VRSLLCLGKLVKLELASGKKASVKGRWLAYDGRNLHVCTVNGTTKAKLPAAVAARHRKFHGMEPKGEPFCGDCPSPQGKLTQLGLLKALVYTVPKKIKSPEKNPYHWHHAFGDTGHAGGEYPESVMPSLMQDTRGNIFIKRRKGNIFKVDDWIRG
jgi:hypothetical protein